MNKITWIRPSGAEIVTNDRDVTIKYCENLGFKRVDEGDITPKEVSTEKKKAGRPKKVESSPE